MDIKKLCYALYKREWTDRYISKERQYDAIRDYYENIEDDEEEYTFDDYMKEFGYGGELYVDFDEFLNYEYLEEKYMRKLLKKKHLIKLYEQDIKEDSDATIVIVTDIKWDAPHHAELPTEVKIRINEDNAYLLDNWYREAEEICDWLTNEYGYCLFGFCVEVINM